jgi:hypothetical protein
MKKILALLICITTCNIAAAQLFAKEQVQNNQNMDKQTLSWGYYFGGNNLGYKIDYNDNKGDIEMINTVGFNVGLIADLRINDYINFRLEPGMVIASRNLQYPRNYFTGVATTESDFIREIKSTYIYVPLLLRLSTKRVNNIKPYVTFGLATAFNLSSNENNPEDNSGGRFRTAESVQFYEIGFGIDFYLYWFKFTPSIRGIFALNNELIRDVDPNSPWTGNIDSMKTRGIFINLAFR